jgi:Ca2+-transporting ATPase
MAQLHHHSGLTDSQVLASRQAHGANVLTLRKKSGFWDKVREACTHGIAYTLYVLTAACIAAAIYLSGDMGSGIWVMPLVIAVATAMILVVGIFGGFKEPLMRVLIAAFVLSIGISIYEYECDGTGLDTFFEPIGIIAALLLATGVAFFLERANEKTFQSLNEVNDDTPVKVVRNGGNTVEVPRRDVVVGDIVLLEAGEEVPADCRLLESLNLSVNESSITGEPERSKTTNPDYFDSDATYPSNEIFKGTIVLEGYCTAEVTKVGDATECGRVFEAAQVSEGSPTPLSEKLNKLAILITRASYIVGILVIVGRLTVHAATGQIDLSSTEGWIDLCTFVLNTVMIAVTLIVVAVPEGLPMSVTMSLALSMRKLMRENTLPRTMHACETMGATSVICTDKTGTLTQNQMQVAEAQIRCDNADLVAEMIAFNTTANLDRSDREHIAAVGNPTEGALLLWLDNEGVDYQVVREQAQIIDRLPFSTENKYMASIVQSPALGGRAVMVKGAPEIILAMTGLSADEKDAIAEQLLVYQSKAMRTLAIAYAEIGDSAEPFVDGKLNVNGLTLGGIFAISDPVRREVPAAIRDCISAGIQVKIVTGDTPGTAKEIGRQIGLWTDADTDRNILTGTEFAALSDEELASRVMDMKIMSRARPNDKERLVRALRARGMVVAVTGDGTNDAPALNAADVGLSMGDGTAVAKEASDMTIQDNSFSTITNAVMWGRSLYKNIQRFIMFQMTINVVACLVVLIGAFIGTESPLTVTQMLWVNLIMDTFAAIALASLPPSHSVMAEKPRRVTDSIISRAMAWNILGVGGLFTAVMLAVLWIMQHADITGIWQIASGQFTLGQYDGLTALELSEFFTLFVMLQFWNMFNAKAFMTGKSAFSNLRQCRAFLGVAAVIFFGQILLVEFGGQMFNVTPFCLRDWLVIILGTSPVLIIGEIIRLVGRRKASQRL